MFKYKLRVSGDYGRRDYYAFKSLSLTPNDTPICFFLVGNIGVDLLTLK